MDAVSGVALEAIEAELTRTVVDDFHLKLDTLFYDTANCFTSLASGHERSAIAQRGPPSRNASICASSAWPSWWPVTGRSLLCRHLRGQYGGCPAGSRRPHRHPAPGGARGRPFEDLTLVYDKGHNAKSNQALVDQLRGTMSPPSYPANTPTSARFPRQPTPPCPGHWPSSPYSAVSTPFGRGADGGPLHQRPSADGPNRASTSY